MRDKMQYIISIAENGYTGSTKEIYSTVEGFTITSGKRDGSELEAMLSSELVLRIKAIDNSIDFRSLYSTDLSKYRVVVTNAAGIVWAGYLATGEYSQPFAAPPYDVELRANDGFEILREQTYYDERTLSYLSTISLQQLIEEILSPISEGLEVRVWGLEAVVLKQGSANTADLIGIDQSLIASAFGGRVPTRYELLDAVLRNYGLQLFQCAGYWCARPVFALAEATRPEWWDATRAIVQPLLNGANGEGMSAAATLSMAPPLRELSVVQHEPTEHSITAINRPMRWLTYNYGNENLGYASMVARGTEGVRVSIFAPSDPGLPSALRGWAAFAFDGVLDLGGDAVLKISASIYNLLSGANSMMFGVYLVDANLSDPLGWLTPSGYVVTAPEDTLKYNGAEFENIGGASSSFLGAPIIGTGVTLDAGKRNIPFAQPYSLKRLEPTQIDYTISCDADLPKKRYRLVLVLSRQGGAELRIELTNVRVGLTFESEVLTTRPEGVYRISRYGSDGISYEQRFADRSDGRRFAGGFMPSTLLLSDGRPIRGMIAPTLRASMAEIISSHLRDLRGVVGQMLEGEIYTSHPVDHNAVWQDDEGRTYYATRIEHLAKRGLHCVQLRQLSSEPERKALRTFGLALTNVAFDTTILVAQGKTLMLVDIVEGSISTIRTFTGEITINKAVGAACIAEACADGTYNLYAIDPLGNEICAITDVYNVATQPTTSTAASSMAANAMYDTSSGLWSLVGNVNDTSDAVRMCLIDSGGALVAEKDAALGRVIGKPRAFTTGFALTTQKASESAPTIWWHNYLIDAELTCSKAVVGMTLEDIGDIWLVASHNGSCYAFERDGMTISTAATFNIAGSLVAINGTYLVASPVSGNYNLMDVRTGNTKTLRLSTSLVQQLLVVGRYVVYMPKMGSMGSITINKIIL